ncbi:MAG: elongation factor 4, partial [Planctomycetota bacterium]
MSIDKIRNFCIVAHIDHGKSTLADRILVLTNTVAGRDIKAQHLDSNSLERERGITIKAKAVAMDWKGYRLNLIDTPGHVDFNYEVSRSLAACEGAILLVDCTQGVQAQTVANALLAVEGGLEIVPALNKIDMQTAQVDESLEEMEHTLSIRRGEVFKISGKTGDGVEELLEAVLMLVPPPKGDPAAPLKALVFDSEFNEFRGVVSYVRLIDGSVRRGDKIRFMGTDKVYDVEYVGLFKPHMVEVNELTAGQVGYLMANIKTIADVRVGDTITSAGPTGKDVKALPGYKEPLPVVFCGFYPTGDTDYEDLKKALDRLSLNDSSFKWQAETSEALGFGFRCGFLGLLHLEIVQERLEREFNLTLLTTAPTVVYKVRRTDGTVLEMENPSALPEPQAIVAIEEPFILASIFTPAEYLGAILALCQEKRGVHRGLEHLPDGRVLLSYELPLNEIVLDFYDRLKSVSRGYASLDYDFLEHRPSPLVKLDILVNGEPVDALSLIIHRDQAQTRGRLLAERMRELIPRQLFEVVIQAAIGGKVIARERVAPLRKAVTAKCYGGDITRKRKLLAKQAEGTRRMKQVGRVEIPQEAFMAMLS